MPPCSPAAAGAIFAALALAAPARADLTPEEVWSSWKAMVEGYGQTLTGTETRSGDTLTVSGLTVAAAMPDGRATVTQGGAIAFRDRGDGSVEIGLPESYMLDLDIAPATGDRVRARVRVEQDALSMIASGSAEAVTYDLAADTLALTLVSAEADGTPVDARATSRMTGMTGAYRITRGEMTAIEGELAATGATFDVSVTVPEENASIRYSGEVSDLAGTSSARTAPGLGAVTLGPILAAGFASEGRVTHGGFAYAMAMQDAGSSTDVMARFDSGSIDFALGGEGMVYDVRSGAGQIAVSGSALPLPRVDLAFAESAFRLKLPLVRTDAPADFELLTRTTGLTISDGIWAMLDPGGQLPRDPASLVLELGGKARWLVDISDPEVVAGAQGAKAAALGELHELNVKDLRLSLAGAELSGNGAFLFDNADTTTFEGLPRPTGGLALKLQGANTLLDRLVGMGLLPAEQATGMRMMLGMFARPTGEGDTLTSTIEVTPEGRVLANGQRLR